MADFLSMGGYGAYVWSAFGISLLALMLLFGVSWSDSRRRARELERWQRRADGAEES